MADEKEPTSDEQKDELGETTETPRQESEKTRTNPAAEQNLLELDHLLMQSREQGVIEPRALAQSMDLIFETHTEDPDQQRQALIDYFRSREEFNFASPEQLSQEILMVEQKIIAGFKEEIQAEHPNAEDRAKIEQTINAVREGLFSMILGGRLRAEHIIGKLDGGIHFKQKPGEEVAKGESYPAEKMTAYTSIKEGVVTITFYDRFLEQGPPQNSEQQSSAQAHIVRHEFGHVLADTEGIWKDEDYQAFLAAAMTLNAEQIRAVSESHPELGGIIAVLQKPEAHPLWNEYLKGRFEKLEGMPEGKTKARERARIANELAVEMTAFYLEGGKTIEEYLCARLQFTEPKRLVDFLLAASGEKTAQEFAQAYGLDPEKDTPSTMIEKLAAREEFATLLKVNEEWFKKMGLAFEERGKKIPVENPTYREYEYGDDYYLGDEMDWYYGSGAERETQGAKAKAENPLVVLWEFITGQKSQKMAA